MHGILTIAHLTWLEARRRRVVLAALLGGLLFVLVFAAALNAINDSQSDREGLSLLQLRVQFQFLLLAGLYVVNFLAIAVAVLLPVDTLAGEIRSGVMQTLASKPVRRSDILLGKWLTYWLMTAVYLALVAGGIVLVMYLLTGVTQQNLAAAYGLMLLGATVMLTISLAGGVALTTITNGMVAFALYGISFIGGWIEQVGTIAGSQTARYIGTATSLISPSDAMWRRAAHELQPPIMRELPMMGPFVSTSVPSTTMIVWTVGFVLVLLGMAIYQFRRRAL